MLVYLDNSATTKVREEVLKEIIEANENYYGNPSSLHRMGLMAGKNIEGEILPELEGLVADFNALTPEQQETVLKDMNYSATTSSTATRNALRSSMPTPPFLINSVFPIYLLLFQTNVFTHPFLMFSTAPAQVPPLL
jgi:hypothetical protein